MQEKKTFRLSTFDPRLWIPVSIFCAIAFFTLFYTNGDVEVGDVILTLVVGGGVIGIAASWLISLCWNIVVAMSNRKSGSLADAIQCGAGFHEWPQWKYAADGQCVQTRRCPVCGEEEEQVEHQMGEFHYTCIATLSGMPEHSERFETLLSTRFGQSELREFCFKNGIDPENLEGDSKIENIQSLIGFHNQSKSVGTLLDALKNYRADLADELEQVFPATLNRTAADTEVICEQHAHCARCGHTEEAHDHFYSEWLRTADDECAFTRTCYRCDKGDSKTEHRWSGKQYAREGSCRQEKVCLTCGLRDDEGELHTYIVHEELAADKQTMKKVKVCSRCGDRN